MGSLRSVVRSDREHLTYLLDRTGPYVWISFSWREPWWARWFFGADDQWTCRMTTEQARQLAETVRVVSARPGAAASA